MINNETEPSFCSWKKSNKNTERVNYGNSNLCSVLVWCEQTTVTLGGCASLQCITHCLYANLTGQYIWKSVWVLWGTSRPVFCDNMPEKTSEIQLFIMFDECSWVYKLQLGKYDLAKHVPATYAHKDAPHIYNACNKIVTVSSPGLGLLETLDQIKKESDGLMSAVRLYLYSVVKTIV